MTQTLHTHPATGTLYGRPLAARIPTTVTGTVRLEAHQLSPDLYIVNSALYDHTGNELCPHCAETLDGPFCCGGPQ